MRAQDPCAARMSRPEPAVRAYGPLMPYAHGILAWALRCRQRAVDRRALAQLGDWQLCDIGISRADAEVEAAKWFWRP
ncbi:MAG TPA: DUF1127 domain-containing protein [Candidatus Acidoferrum sp.]|nr:DUF1127 domain-containing protein [Candidatus Acidoferrum sp.]